MDGPMDGLGPVEVFFSFSEERMLGRDRTKKGGEKESEKNGFGYLDSCFQQLIYVVEERKKKFTTPLFRKAAMAQSPFEAGKEGKKQPRPEHQIERGLCRALLEVP